jgi:hypothetical protein
VLLEWLFYDDKALPYIYIVTLFYLPTEASHFPSAHIIYKTWMGNAFLHQNIHKYTWPSPDRKMHSQVDQILMDGKWHSRMILQGSCDGDQLLLGGCRG